MPAAEIPLQGFAPDLDPRVPGIFSATSNVIFTERGLRPLPSLVQAFDDVLPDACEGAFTGITPFGQVLLFLATKDEFYEVSVSGITLVGTVTRAERSSNRWRFAQFGKYTIAVNGNAQPVYYGGAEKEFTYLPDNPPKGHIVETTGLHVLMFGDGNLKDAWAACGLGNVLAWKPDPATQAVRGRLIETSGDITAARRLSDNQIIVYKKQSCYLGQYIGPPVTWSFRLLSSEAGALSQECVIPMPDSHFVVGNQDFFLMQGPTPPRPLESPLRHWFYKLSLDTTRISKIFGWWNRDTRTVFIHYPSLTGGGAVDSWIAWCHQTNKWTQGTMPVVAAAYMESVSQETPVTWANLQTLFGGDSAKYSDVGGSYTSRNISGVPVYEAILVGADKKCYTLTGTPGISSIKTGDMGNIDSYTLLRRVRPQFAVLPTSPVVLSMSQTSLLGGDERIGRSSVMSVRDGWINLRQSARWHRGVFAFEGDYELLGYEVDTIGVGVR